MILLVKIFVSYFLDESPFSKVLSYAQVLSITKTVNLVLTTLLI